MGFFSQRKQDVEDRLRMHEGDIHELVDALLNGEEDVDIRLAELVEDEQELVRIAIVEKTREMVEQQNAEKLEALEQIIEEQKLLAKQQKHTQMQQWLAYVMSQDTLKKIRESLLSSPGLAQQIQNIGQELAKRGVLFNLNPGGKKDMGNLSANVQQSKDQGQGKGSGRGM